METVLIIAGIAVILFGLWDMFHQLLHPRGQGPLSGLIFTGVWKIARASGHRLGFALGPATMVGIVMLWVLIQGVGWALIYYPHVPAGFLYSDGINPADYAQFAEALYISLVTLATLGFGDVVAIGPTLRLAAPIQGLTGFALLTGALTWFMQVYPPLLRRRSAALTLKALSDAGYVERLSELDSHAASGQLDLVAEQISQVCVDLDQHSETYYFQVDTPEVSFSHHLPYALELQRAGAESTSLEVRMTAAKLETMLGQLGDALSPGFVSGEQLDEIFSAYAADHPRRG
ncbi:potassium channel family protein [Nesterenkonia halotolerans]|uniref:Potassium channel domain-containing protein n=1 Tax=Nesterenkonia halotolerans TaxID=225325 RepID=A0ABR9J7L5_9MICC|nr:potassium channel family protein [Nesterenkonia halotolerans]MBE1514985.1 hypothetical protein [Nesterenkonia halotolerans]